jgi:hypothetical protein
MVSRTLAALVALSLAALFLGGCPDNKSSSGSTPSSATAPAAKSATPAASATGNGW